MAPHRVTKPTATGLAQAASLSSRVYLTFLAGAGDYVKGVVGLAKGLRKVKAVYPLVVAVLNDVPEEHRRMLVAQGCMVREIGRVHPPENGTKFAWEYHAINYSKLRIWEFVEYHKMIYLDGDIQVYDNIDHLFDLPDGSFYGVGDCLCMGWDEQCPDKVPWSSELGPEPALYFNAGMLVFEPSLSTYDDLLNTLKVTPHTPFAEQDFLNMFFKDIFKPVPPIYNLIVATLWRHPGHIEIDKVKVVHYCAEVSKPWRYNGKGKNMDREDIRMLVNKWWDIYNDESLNYKWISVSSAVDGMTEKTSW
ncbi:galactinol synthase 2-like [Rhododendron vialii]|uniref:galactinol synthase 2-like n=1 Tax=Rhododendron vialii TaxID=182163 RepID=UPI0026601641|nr:galactinol synthase 2-like [Rhododendron vialii]